MDINFTDSIEENILHKAAENEEGLEIINYLLTIDALEKNKRNKYG